MNTPLIARIPSVMLGTAFALIGFVSFLNVIVALHFNGTFLWLSFIYCLIDGLVAYGFIKEKKWIIPLLLANLAYIGLLVARDSSKTLIAILVANALISAFFIWKRGFLNGRYFEKIPTAIFVILWLLTTQWGI